MARTLFTHVKIFDGTGSAPFAGEVLVQGNRIDKVAKGKARIARDGAEVIDGGGGTLMPGLIEGHGHISYTDFVSLDDVSELPPEDHALRTAQNAEIVLDSGFTSVFSGGAFRPRMDVAVRDAIEAGRIRGPRLKASSPAFVSSGGLGDQRKLHFEHAPIILLVDGADDMRRMARVMVREGVDSIKVNVSGDPGLRTGADLVAYTEAEVAATAEVALAHGINLTCHARATESIKLSLRLGFNVLFHCDFADSEALDMLEARKDTVFLAPAVGQLYTLAYEAAEWGITPEYADGVLDIPRLLENSIRTHIEAHKRGVRIVPGGDYGVAWNPMGTNARDLEHFVNLYEFSPAEALMAATKWGGEQMGMGDELGLVKPGYLADLLCIDGDPTKEITIMQDRDKIVAIMKDGAFHKPPSPAARLAQAV